MRYRDLVFVLCLVAVAAVWWSYPAGDEPLKAEVAVSLSPSPLVSATPEEPPLKLKSSEFEVPKVPELTLVLKERGKTIEDIVLQATLTTEVDALIPMSDGRPVTTIHTESVGHSMDWLPRNEDKLKKHELKKGETLTWDIRIGSHKPWEEVATLTDWSPSEPLVLGATIVEGGSIEPSPFMRSMFVKMHGEVTVPSYKE